MASSPASPVAADPYGQDDWRAWDIRLPVNGTWTAIARQYTIRRWPELSRNRTRGPLEGQQS